MRLKPEKREAQVHGYLYLILVPNFSSLCNRESSCPAVGGLSKMMSLNVARFKGMWYGYPVPEMKMMESEVKAEATLV